MPTYRVKFRIEKDDDHIITASAMNESKTSYQFWEDGNIVAQIPRDVILFVTEEKAIGQSG